MPSAPFTLSSTPTILRNNLTTTATSAQLNDLTAAIPQKLAVVPDLGDQSGPNWHPKLRLLTLCEALSIINQSDEFLHVVDSEGYTIKCPRTFEHRHRSRLKFGTTVLKYLVAAIEFAASFAINVSSRPGDLAMSALSSTCTIAGNKELLDTAGITPDSLFSVQHIPDPHQERATTKLLQGADRHGKDNITGNLERIVHEGRSLWVCRRCFDDLQNRQVIDETRLGQVLRQQKNLTHLEIHANSTEEGQVYIGLRAVLESRTLKSLRVSGIPCFFQSADIPIKCRRLEELSLQGVYLNEKQSARNLWRLVEVNPGLVKLKMAGAKLTASVLSIDMIKAAVTQLRKIESLDLSSNDLGEQEVTRFVRTALGNDRPRLRRLYLSGNTKLGDEGCRRVIGLLVGKECWLEKLEVKNTGVNLRTIESVRTYLSDGSRCVYPV
ncbi:hypothetical protein B0O80DRAFT_425762 [Mortierella sp. GBAus27b]|nr:hypothetical protein B0O80DRAFT_425762 [Mortierella sp. GBAus27b]